jgi:hypothetical protein
VDDDCTGFGLMTEFVGLLAALNPIFPVSALGLRVELFVLSLVELGFWMLGDDGLVVTFFPVSGFSAGFMLGSGLLDILVAGFLGSLGFLLSFLLFISGYKIIRILIYLYYPRHINDIR